MPFKDHDINKALKNLHQMENEVERLLKDFFISKNPMLMVSENAWTPHIDVYETSDAFIIKADIAGVTKENIKIQMKNRSVVITGKRVDDCEEAREHFHLAEVSYGVFVRQIELPGDLDRENVVAKFKDGFLKIFIPKAQEASHKSYSISISD
jgi:HSP20 family protein